MSRIQKALDALRGKVPNPPAGKKKRMTSQIDTTAPDDRVKMEMDYLITAIENALYPGRPDRRNLIVIYSNTEDDAHVMSQVEIAKSKLIAEPFTITRNGTEDAQLMERFKAAWFEDWLEIIIDSMNWGYTLVEAGPIINDNWSSFNVFPRRHVEPFKKHILVRPSDVEGVPYGDNPSALYLLEIGNAKDLGKFKTVAREVIWKNFSRTDWSQASEKFGMPFLYYQTGTEDADELDRIEALCRNFASNGYVIGHIDDKITITQATNSDFYKIYQENATFCDQQISKCINGQTGTSDEKSFVGAAEVHERILDDFTERRLRKASNLTNNILMPFLAFHGWPVEGAQFRFPALEKKASDSSLQDDDPGSDPDNTNPGLQSGDSKKKVQSKLKLPSWVIDTQAE
jgi:phage gp29-like protein